MARKFIAILVVFLVAASQIYAQRQSDLPLELSTAKSSFSLFDPGRFHMSQSYSMMYTTSQYGSYSLGLYLNTIEYQISDPLRIRLDIGYLHSPDMVLSNTSTAFQKGKILPAISISWRPSENFYFQFDYRELPSFFNNYGFDSYNKYHQRWEGY